METGDRPAAEFKSPSGPATTFSEGEMIERNALGLPLDSLSPRGLLESMPGETRRGVRKRAIRASDVLNDAADYPRPSSFSRGLRADLKGGVTHLFLSGTASVGPNGETLYPGDFRAQLWRAYRNLTRLLESEGATWHDVVRCTCYISDIERDYADFNAIRTEFFSALALDPLPASTAIQARLCRSDLLVELDAHAILDVSSPPA
jgi:enamine deaminase RidA (YjgF/YER057c/UK114 family)